MSAEWGMYAGAPPGEYMASYVGTAYCLDVDSRPMYGFPVHV